MCQFENLKMEEENMIMPYSIGINTCLFAFLMIINHLLALTPKAVLIGVDSIFKLSNFQIFKL
jgi:hypothetical protein